MDELFYLTIKQQHQRYTFDLVSQRFTTLRNTCKQNGDALNSIKNGFEILGDKEIKEKLKPDIQKFDILLKSEQEKLNEFNKMIEMYPAITNALENDGLHLWRMDIQRNVNVLSRQIAKAKFHYYQLMDSLYDRISYNSNLTQQLYTFKRSFILSTAHSIGFPFLKLPFVVRDQVFRMMNFIDL